MLKLWVMSQQAEVPNHKAMTSCDDASTLKSKHGQYFDCKITKMGSTSQSPGVHIHSTVKAVSLKERQSVRIISPCK